MTKVGFIFLGKVVILVFTLAYSNALKAIGNSRIAFRPTFSNTLNISYLGA